MEWWSHKKIVMEFSHTWDLISVPNYYFISIVYMRKKKDSINMEK